MVELRVDPEFHALCTELTPEEVNLLEASLEKDGCRDAIVTWANHDDTILDGHNRFPFCKQFDIPFKIKGIKLETRGDAINWIINNQLGKRNLNDQQKAYLRGKRFKSEKKEEGRPEKLDQTSPVGSTRARLAKEYSVGEGTIERDAHFSEAVDTLAKAAGPETKTDILSGRSGLTKKDVIALAELPKAEQKKALAGGKPAVKAAIKEAAPQPKAPPISDVLFKAFKELVERTSSITEQFGGVRKMLDSKIWKDQDTGAFCGLVIEISKTFSQWRKEVEQYAKDRKTEF